MRYTKKQAHDILVDLLWCFQRARSTTFEAFGTDPVFLRVASKYLEPWTFDEDRVPIDVLVHLIDRSESTGQLAPLDFYNLMWIAQRCPTVQAAAFATRVRSEPFPEPEIEWMQGWADDASIQAVEGV